MTPRFAFYLPDFLSEKHARTFTSVVETRMPSCIVVLAGLDGFVLLQLAGDPDTVALENRLAKWHLETACD
jgi:hypothetical protein